MGAIGEDVYLVLIVFITVLGRTRFRRGREAPVQYCAGDGVLPGHKCPSRTRESNGTAYGAVIAIAVITAPLLIAPRTSGDSYRPPLA